MAIRREPREAGKRAHDARRDHHIAGVRRANGFKAIPCPGAAARRRRARRAGPGRLASPLSQVPRRCGRVARLSKRWRGVGKLEGLNAITSGSRRIAPARRPEVRDVTDRLLALFERQRMNARGIDFQA